MEAQVVLQIDARHLLQLVYRRIRELHCAGVLPPGLAPRHRALPRHPLRGFKEEEPSFPVAPGGHSAGEEAATAGAGLEMVPPRSRWLVLVLVLVVSVQGEEVSEGGDQRLDAGVLAAQHERSHVLPRIGDQLARRQAVVPEELQVEVVEREPQTGLERVFYS